MDKDGGEAYSLRSIPITRLLDKIAGDDVEIEDDALGKLRVYGYDEKTTVTVSSFEIAERFELLPPGADPANPRHAVLKPMGDYAESEKYVLLYFSTEEAERLTDGQWTALAGMGILAIHNPNPIAQGAGKAAKEVLAFHDHHLFPQRFHEFFNDILGKDMFHEFTVQVESSTHLSKAQAWNSEWRSFINKQKGLMAQGKKKHEVLRDTMNHMLDLAEKPQFNYNVLDVRKYGRKLPAGVTAEPGSSLDKLFQLANKGGKINLKTNTRWRTLAARAAKRFGNRFMKVLPVIGYALTAWAVINAVADPVGALAAEIGCDRDVAQAYLDGQATIGIAWWVTNQSVTSAELGDAEGTVISVGERVWVRFRRPKENAPGEIEYETVWIKFLEIKEIYTTDTPGTVNLVLDDGSEKGLQLPGLKQYATFPLEDVEEDQP